VLTSDDSIAVIDLVPAADTIPTSDSIAVVRSETEELPASDNLLTSDSTAVVDLGGRHTFTVWVPEALRR